MPSITFRNVIKTGALLTGAFAVAKFALRKPTDFELAGKTVLITGGSRGLGLVLAREFLKENARVVICARDQDELDRARLDLLNYGPEVLAISCDVRNESEVSQLVRTVREQFGDIDVLVNNAGVIQVGPLEVMTRDDFKQAMDTHFWGPLNSMLAVLPSMREKKAGRIINISSIGGKIGVPHLVPYSASKFALVGLSEGLRAELSKDRIVVTTVCPGLMRTGSPRNANFKGRHRAEYAWFSIADALPLTSISADRAARQIISACKQGKAELTISIQAKVAVLFHSLFPETTAELSAVINDLLPRTGGIGTQRAKGRDSTSSWSPSLLTTLNERAARRNNEIVHEA